MFMEFAWRPFHETPLSHGRAPLPALREVMPGAKDSGTWP